MMARSSHRRLRLRSHARRGQDLSFAEVKKAYDIILIRSDFIRPRPEEEICTRCIGIETTIPENSTGSRADEGRESNRETHRESN